MLPRPSVSVPERPDQPRVLLVDPDDAERARTARILLDRGVEVVAAVNSYAQGIVAARRHNPSVIITELCAGQILTPPQYVVALRRFCGAPVIVLTGDVPSAGEVASWGLWAALVKGAARAPLVDAIYRAHDSVRRARAR